MNSKRSEKSMSFRIVSSGFAALDVVLGEDGQSRAAAGGTSVNVAAALVSMGWEADVVGTIGDDPAGRYLVRDLGQAGVGVAELQLDPSWTTPVVLQEACDGDHAWRFTCPRCGEKFAKHRPSPSGRADRVVGSMQTPDVFFFDRTSLFTLRLAEMWRAKGTLIVFEPASLGRPQLFERAVSIAHVVKFSDQRVKGFQDWLSSVVGLQVSTSGPDGLSFGWAADKMEKVPGRRAISMVDSAGAGDWTTAGFLRSLFAAGVDLRDRDDSSAAREVLKACLHDAQAWGALACGWAGAREAVGPSERNVIRNMSELVCRSL